MLFLLNETATLYRRTGQSAGKPAWANDGIGFQCRTQPYTAQQATAQGYSGDADTRVYALPDLEAAAGDKILFDDGSFAIVREVYRRRGMADLHHLEILGKRGG